LEATKRESEAIALATAAKIAEIAAYRAAKEQRDGNPPM